VVGEKIQGFGHELEIKSLDKCLPPTLLSPPLTMTKRPPKGKSEIEKITKLVTKIEQNAEKHRTANEDLLSHIGANTVPNAKRKLDAERREFEQTKEQLLNVVDALEVDNWRNAIVRAKSLLNKLEQNRMPKWLLVPSRAWEGTVPPTQFRTWLRFCQEQFMLVLSEMELQAEQDPDYDIIEQLDTAKELYHTREPGRFVQECADFVLGETDFEVPIVEEKSYEIDWDISQAEMIRSREIGKGEREQ
jgi:hypothetical protein